MAGHADKIEIWGSRFQRSFVLDILKEKDITLDELKRAVQMGLEEMENASYCSNKTWTFDRKVRYLMSCMNATQKDYVHQLLQHPKCP